MQTGVRMRKMLVVGIAAMMLLGAAGSADAAGKRWLRREAKAARCGTHQTVVRIDTKICPATGRRGAVSVRRACCENPAGKRFCKPFVSCPRISPS